MRPLIYLLICLILTSCANNEVILPLAVADRRVATIEHIHVATMREASDNALAVYSGSRSGSINFAEMDISVPRNREPGTIVYPRKVPNLAEQFAAVRHVTNKSEQQFIGAINADLAKRSPASRTIMLFVHGYNTNFASGILRQAQMVHDFGFEGVPVNFSWASAGRTALYLYDRDSAQLARNGLRDTLKVLARTNARGIVLLGHSMGGFVAMETLRDIGIRKEQKLLNRLEAVILASPDIDGKVFQTQIREVKPLPQPFMIFVSSRDRALQISQRLRGGEFRLGAGANIEELRHEGITVIDLSNVEDGTDATNHTTFATSKTVMNMVRSGALRRNTPEAQNAAKPLAPIGEGIGKLSDVASAIIYLPAKIAGVR